MANYPTSLDNFTNPTSGNNLNSPSHSQQHSDANDAIEALEAKVGIGASTPTTNKVLRGTGTGDSAWGNVVEADISLSDNTTNDVSTTKHGFVPKAPNDTTKVLRGDGTWATVASMDTAPPNLLKNGNFINNSTNGYGSTPDDWTSSNANPVQGGIPSLTKQNLIDILGVADGDIEAWYNLNGNLNDLSSNGYNLTAGGGGAAPTDTSDGLMAQAKVFAGASSQYAVTSGAANARINGSKTLIGFVKPTNVSDTNKVHFGLADSTDTHYFRVRCSTTKLYADCSGLTGAGFACDVDLQAGKWYMVVLRYNASNNTLDIIINGIKKSVAVTGTPTVTNQEFAVGRNGDNNGAYASSTLQNCGILSVALSDDQVKRLLAATMYKGQKIRRATTDGYLYQDLPMDLVERLRGKTVALRADMYQEVASTGQISILQTLADGTTSESIISATDATTGSWLEKLATGTISATAVGIQIRLKHSTSDGNTWFKKVSLYEGSVLLPYDHSKDDWSRFPRLLRMDIPAVISGYQFEEGRWFDWTISWGGFSSAPTGGTHKFCISNHLASFFRITGSSGTSNATTTTINLPVLPKNTQYSVSVINVVDNGSNQSATGHAEITAASTILSLYKTYFRGEWTASSNKDVNIPLSTYEID